MNPINKSKIDWNKIDTVLLDMDGTLIDQYHEDIFWDNKVPQEYAKKHYISTKEASQILHKMYKEKEGTKEWGNLDFWEKKLAIDMWKIRYSIGHMIKLHPHTLKFLKFLKRHKKKIRLVTSAYPKDMHFKINKIGIGNYFDSIHSENEINKSKHDTTFWKRLNKIIKFDKDKTLLVENDEKVLKSARLFGIKYLVLKSKYSSRKPAKYSKEFVCVHHFDDII
ncbi:HAD hydrolase-like protein [archaeon]|nr:HAD hydrolase-like protein [archaeon]